MTKQLDLHGVRHHDVERLVENFVLLNELPLRIITGNSPKMLSLVSEVLDRHEFKYEQFKQGQVIILK
tara:strand:+ start:543 stop:746 length:204 start_codon:yes stop_codon:yes gene_type:complete